MFKKESPFFWAVVEMGVGEVSEERVLEEQIQYRKGMTVA